MNKAKIPYLQYEILEYFYLKLDKTLGDYVGFNDDGRIVESAIIKLKQKKLLDTKNNLTVYGETIVKKHVEERFNLPDYKNIQLEQTKQKSLFPKITNDLHGNKNGIVFRWYKYLEDFPHEFIISSINKYKIDKEYYILDPFNGSGTTQIQAKMHGFKSVGFDTNPAMVFIAENKLNWDIGPLLLKSALKELIISFKKPDRKEIMTKIFPKTTLANMPKTEINQWLSPVKQYEVAYALYLIERLSKKYDKIRNLLKFIATSSAVSSSYVAFCPGTTFYPFRQKPDYLNEFVKLGSQVLNDLQNEKIFKNKNIESEVILGSSKDPETFKKIKGGIDLIITSPPYPNDLEYTRQTRLELYLLGFVKNMGEVQQIKKNMVKGSTKLIYKEDEVKEEILEIKSINKITKELTIRLSDKNWGFDYPKMIQQYFSDMWVCLENYHNYLVKNGKCILVVGDQTFKGVVIPVAEILEEMAARIGYSKSGIELHRKRRSTTHNIPIPEENLILTK